MKFSPYQVEGIHFFFLLFLLISKFSLFQNSPYKKEIEVTARENLSKRLKRTPSKSEIVVHTNDYLVARDTMLGITGLAILIIGVFLKNAF